MNAIKRWPPEGKSIQCSSLLRRVQDSSSKHIRMAKEDEQSFDWVPFLAPGEKEGSELMPIFRQLSPLPAYLFLSVIVGKGKRSGGHSRGGDNEHLAWCVVQRFTGLFSPSIHWFISMAPRYRATPRWGRHQGQRSGAGRRGNRSPRRISPLNCASPSSNRTEDSGQSIFNSVQSARFHYRRRTNRPVISALITIIFEEEDGVEGTSEEHLPGSSNISSPSGRREDSSYAPSSPSKLVAESSPAPTEEQVEARAEIGSMLDLNEPVMAQDQPRSLQEQEDATTSAPQTHGEPKLPDFHYANTLYPILPPGMKLEDVPEGMEISWEPLDEFKFYKPDYDK